MPHLRGLSQWQQLVSTQFSHLSRPQVLGLSLWSAGIVLAQRCGLTQVAVVLAYLLGRREAAVREQLRDTYRDAPHKSGAKRGAKRRTLEVRSCFAPLLRWVMALMPPTCRRLALAMDATTLGQRFTVLSIHVVIQGCAIPVAWHIVRATAKGAWRPHWEALFAALKGAVPADWTVVVAADRGLYAKWLFTTITKLGWHPLLRINRQGKYCPADSTTFRPLSQVVTNGGPAWQGQVTCFATPQRQLTCTLLARWDPVYQDPWLIVTDLAPTDADVAWYGMRAWIEASYKDLKHDGWRWEQTKMTDPRRAERVWLVMALATLWVVSTGSAAEAALPAPARDLLPETHIARRTVNARQPPRALSCFQRGRLLLITAMVSGQELPPMQLHPAPWPESLDTHGKRPPADRPHQQAA
jgi:hypothetical protein